MNAEIFPWQTLINSVITIADEAMKAAHVTKAETLYTSALMKQRDSMLQILKKSQQSVDEKEKGYEKELQKANQLMNGYKEVQGSCLGCAINPATMHFAPQAAIGAAFAGQFMEVSKGESSEAR